MPFFSSLRFSIIDNVNFKQIRAFGNVRCRWQSNPVDDCDYGSTLNRNVLHNLCNGKKMNHVIAIMLSLILHLFVHLIPVEIPFTDIELALVLSLSLCVCVSL